MHQPGLPGRGLLRTGSGRVSAVTGSQVEGVDLDDDDDDHDGPWWKDREILLPAFSGLALLAGLICEWSGAEIPALALFWAGQ